MLCVWHLIAFQHTCVSTFIFALDGSVYACFSVHIGAQGCVHAQFNAYGSRSGRVYIWMPQAECVCGVLCLVFLEISHSPVDCAQNPGMELMPVGTPLFCLWHLEMKQLKVWINK